MKKFILLIGMGLLLSPVLKAQDDLLGDLMKEDSATVKQNITIATFKATRLINLHSTEMTGVGNLQFLIIHHFGPMWEKNQEGANFARLFGLNGGFANTYMSFDYSPKHWMNLGLAFTGNATLEGTVKFRLMRQQTGLHNYPVSIVFLTTANVNFNKLVPAPNDFFWNKLSYLHQLLISRKITDKFSLQLSPSMVHNNITAYGLANSNNIFSIGLGGRMKLTDKKAITFEYSRQLNMYENIVDKNGEIVSYAPDMISLGYDWDTGGHIFQFFITNTSNASNVLQLSQNVKKKTFGEYSLGFNLNRSYSVKHTVKTTN